MAIESLSQILFDGSGSTGKDLSYVIDFGDGARSEESSVHHQVDANGDGAPLARYTATLTVTDRFGRVAADRRSYEVGSIRDFEATPPATYPYLNWRDYNANPCLHVLMSRTRQTGRNVTTDLLVSTSGKPACPPAWSESANVSGQLSGERDVLFTLPSGVTAAGIVTLTRDQSTIDIEIHGGIANGQRVRLYHHDEP
jgi:hypothetical protein